MADYSTPTKEQLIEQIQRKDELLTYALAVIWVARIQLIPGIIGTDWARERVAGLRLTLASEVGRDFGGLWTAQDYIAEMVDRLEIEQ